VLKVEGLRRPRELGHVTGETRHGDAVNDDVPYLVQAAGKTMVVIPYKNAISGLNDTGMYRRGKSASDLLQAFRDEFDILYGTGISREGELVDIGSDMGVLAKSGAWYSFEGDRIGQGRENVKQFLREHPDISGQLMELIRAKAGLKSPPREPANGPDGG